MDLMQCQAQPLVAAAVVVAVVAVAVVVMEDHVEVVADQEAKMLW